MCSKGWRSIRLIQSVNESHNSDTIDDEMNDYMKRLTASTMNGMNGSESRDLMSYFENKVFIWQTDDQCVYCCRLRDETNIINIQCLALTNPPLFEVDCLKLSIDGHYLAVCGSRGITIMEMPPKWGLNGGYEGGKVTVLSRSWSLAERFFVCNQNITLLCAQWHPVCQHQQHIALLTNDNCFRIFDIKDEQTPVQVINLSTTGSDAAIDEIGISLFAQSLGENAVSFDFGPSISKCYDVEPSDITTQDECLFPIYVLKGNGDVLLVYSSLKYSYVSKCIFGPLTMLPPAEDNYGVDACSLMCIDCVPPIIVIATSSGILHHCIALDSDDELTSDRSLLPQPTLYVYETIELSLSLTTGIDSQSISSPLRLHRDSIIPMRYYCSHAYGVHAICVPFVSQLKSKQDITFKEEESIVEHLICTKSIGSEQFEESSRDTITPLGLAIGVHKGYTSILVLLSSGELIGQRLTPTYLSHVFDENRDENEKSESLPVSLPKVDFVEYVKQCLKRNTSLPLLKSKESANNQSSQNLELLLTTTDILRKEYIHKLELASVAIQRRVKVLINDKQIQMKELFRFKDEKETLLNSLLELTDKYDRAVTKQESLSQRIETVLEALQYQRPELSNAEISLRNELRNVSNKLTSHRNKLERIKVKCNYQEKQTNNGNEANLLDASRQRSQPFNQIKSIKEMLANEGKMIEDLVQKLNCIKNGLE